MRTADRVQPARGGIDNDDLTLVGLRVALRGDDVKRDVELWLILADDHDRDHGR